MLCKGDTAAYLPTLGISYCSDSKWWNLSSIYTQPFWREYACGHWRCSVCCSWCTEISMDLQCI